MMCISCCNTASHYDSGVSWELAEWRKATIKNLRYELRFDLVENIGSANSGILEELKAHMTFEGKYPSLKGILGDFNNFYRPYQIDLTNNFIDFASKIAQGNIGFGNTADRLIFNT